MTLAVTQRDLGLHAFRKVQKQVAVGFAEFFGFCFHLLLQLIFYKDELVSEFHSFGYVELKPGIKTNSAVDSVEGSSVAEQMAHFSAAVYNAKLAIPRASFCGGQFPLVLDSSAILRMQKREPSGHFGGSNVRSDQIEIQIADLFRGSIQFVNPSPERDRLADGLEARLGVPTACYLLLQVFVSLRQFGGVLGDLLFEGIIRSPQLGFRGTPAVQLQLHLSPRGTMRNEPGLRDTLKYA